MIIFSHKDSDGDSVEVKTHRSDSVRVFSKDATDGEQVVVVLDREAVQRLYTVMGAWLYPTGPKEPLPVRHPVSLTAADVRSIAGEVVAEVIPLHLARYVGKPETEARHCPECMTAGCRGVDCAWDTDPTPTPKAEQAPPCTGCGHMYDRHRPFCATVENASVCRCFRYRSAP